MTTNNLALIIIIHCSMRDVLQFSTIPFVFSTHLLPTNFHPLLRIICLQCV